MVQVSLNLFSAIIVVENKYERLLSRCAAPMLRNCSITKCTKIFRRVSRKKKSNATIMRSGWMNTVWQKPGKNASKKRKIITKEILYYNFHVEITRHFGISTTFTKHVWYSQKLFQQHGIQLPSMIAPTFSCRDVIGPCPKDTLFWQLFYLKVNLSNNRFNFQNPMTLTRFLSLWWYQVHI